MADKTISDLEQLAELLDNLLIPVEGSTTNTSSVSLGQLRDFLYAQITTLNVTGSAPTYSLNPAVNTVNKCDLSSINASDTVNINLPSGLVNKEAQIVLKINNQGQRIDEKIISFEFGVAEFSIDFGLRPSTRCVGWRNITN